MLKEHASQVELIPGPPKAMARRLGKGEVCCGFDSVGKPIGQFIGVVPHSLASERSSGGSVTALAVAVGDHSVVGFQFNPSALLGRVREHFEFPRVDLPRSTSGA